MKRNDKVVMRVKEYLDTISDIRYGVYIGDKFCTPSKDIFMHKYKNMTPHEVKKYQCGVCWDVSRMIYKDLVKVGIECREIYLISHVEPNYPTHSFVVFKDPVKWRICEYSWKKYKGISGSFPTIEDICICYGKRQSILLNETMCTPASYFTKFFDISGKCHPGYHNTCEEYMAKCSEQKEVYTYTCTGME